MPNPLSGNIKENLTDGDFLLSPSLTNLYEAAHGNGIMLYEDGATSTSGRRNTPADLPGAISASVNVLTIKGGYASIDGLLVDFGGGYDAGHDDPLDFPLQLKSTTIEGGGTELTSDSQTALLVVYVSTDGGSSHIQVEMGSAVTSGFPITPEAFLNDPKSALSSKQSTVLAVLKVTRDASNGTNNDLNLNVANIYDMRTFIRPNAPLYMAPMTKDDVAVYTNRINKHDLLDGMHGGSNENGSFTGSKFGALWMSKNTSDDSVLFFSGEQGSARYSWRLGPNAVVRNTNMNGDITFKKDGGTTFILTATGGSGTPRKLIPIDDFPLSHTINVYNYSGDSTTVVFSPGGSSTGSENQTGANTYNIAPAQSIIFVYTNITGGASSTNGWQQAFVSGNANTTVGGNANGQIQLKNGNNFSASSDLSYSSNILTINGKVSLNNLLENPTGIVFKGSVTSNPGTTAASTLWRDEDDDRLYFGSTKILLDGDSVGATTILGLTDVDEANFTGHAGQFLKVNSGETKVVFSPNIPSSALVSNLNTITNIGHAGTLVVNQDLTVTGNLTVSGDSTIMNVGTIEVEDKTIELAKVAGSQGDNAAANGAGIIVDSSDGDKDILYDNTTNVLGWAFSENIVPKNGVTKTVGTSVRKWNNGHFTSLNSGALTATTITGSSTLAIDTDVLKVDVANDRVGVKQGTPLATLQMKSIGFEYISGSGALSSSSATNVVIFNKTQFRSAKIMVELVNSTDSRYEAHEVLLTHTGSAASVTTYGSVRSDTSIAAVTIGADINSNDVRLTLTAPSSQNGDTYAHKIGWQAFAI